jgi:hypothetical protein
MKGIVKIKTAFPSLPVEFYDILCERLKEKEFSNERFNNAVDGVIDTCKYPTPTVAHFMCFDEEYTCAFGFKFGEDHTLYAGCEDCEDYSKDKFKKCFLARVKKK